MQYIVLTVMLLSTGFSYAQQKGIQPDLKKQIEEYIASGDEMEGRKDYNQAGFFYNKVANMYWSEGLHVEALAYFGKALRMNQNLGNTNGIRVIATNLGMVSTDIANHQAALDHFTLATEAARKLGKKLDIASSLLNESNSLYELQRYSESLSRLEEVHGLAQEINDLKVLRSCYSNLTRVYDKLGNRDKSAEYFNLFASLTRKIQTEEMLRKEAEARQKVDSASSVVKRVEAEKEITTQRLMAKSEELMQKQETLEKVQQLTREQQMQIDLLNREMELREAKIKHQKLIEGVYIATIVVTLMFAGLIFYGYTEKKKANRLLLQKNEEISRQKGEIELQAEQLRDLNALKDKLFSIIAHDLRSPLYSLMSLLNLAKEGHFTEEEFKSIIGELSSNVSYSSALLENLLCWSKSQLHGTKVNPVAFDLYELVTNKFDLYKEKAAQKGIALINNISEHSIVFADKDMIDLIFRNLINNAIKFCNPGDKIKLTVLFRNNLANVCIEDTGIGIDAEHLRKLFGKQIFTTPGTNNEKGTGLGLILCKDFIHLNGGDIWAESEVNRGSKFFFTVPTSQS